MINIDTLTLGNEFKDADGLVFKVTSNFSEGDKLYIELSKVANEEFNQLISEV